MDLNKTFVYGTQYWRPPNPSRQQHRFHLEKIKNDLKFDLVKFRIQWNWHHRQPSCFIWDEVHELFDICDRIELGVQLELNLETAPYWVEQDYPEARYVNANGRPIELGSQEAAPGGGHPGLCFHHDEVRKQSEIFIRAMVNEFKDRKSLVLYDCWNEPHLEPVWCSNMWGNMGDKIYCYCESSRQRFRQWLKHRYENIDNFNNTWARAYTSFDQINPPILTGLYADWIDWFRFWHSELQEYMAWRLGIIKQEDPSRMVASHSGAVPPVLPRANACIENWKFAQPVDLWGTSFAPQAFNWDLATCAQVIELTRCAARNKNFWVAEMPGGPACNRGFRSGRLVQPKDYELWNWIAATFGSKGTMHWCYLTEKTGHEAGNFGMMRLNGEHTPRSLSIRKTAALLREYQDTLISAKLETQVAVLYDPDISSLLFAMELEDTLYGQSHTGYYRAVWNADLYARYVTPEFFDDIREKVLIVPMPLLMSDELADKIADYVYNGGTLITDCRMGMFDQRGFLRPVLPAGKLSKASGLVEGEQICSDRSKDPGMIPTADGSLVKSQNELPAFDPIQLGPTISFNDPIQANIDAQEFLVSLELKTAGAIGKYDNITLGAKNKYGKGVVYYFGTYMGLALDKKIPQALELVKTLLLQTTKPIISGKKLRPRLIRGKDTFLLVVFNNDMRQGVQEKITLPAECNGLTSALDIYSKEIHPIENNRISLVIEPGHAAVLFMEG